MAVVPQLKWQKTGWFIPSVGKFIWRGYYSETAGTALISLNIKEAVSGIPDYNYWFKLGLITQIKTS